MDFRASSSNLLDEALAIRDVDSDGRSVLLIEDSVETSGAFILHHLIKRSLTFSNGGGGGGIVVFVAFAHPFSHYDRSLRKLGCNLSVQRQNNKFIFLNEFSNLEKKKDEGSLLSLYAKIRNAVEVNVSSEDRKNHVTVMIDDASLLEVAADGSSDSVTDFLHYCHTLCTDFGSSLVILNHEDIYSCIEGPTPLTWMEYLADLIIRVEPLATGLAADVHGQLTVLNKLLMNERTSSSLHFKVKENCVDYFYPGS